MGDKENKEGFIKRIEIFRMLSLEKPHLGMLIRICEKI
jgi:hypothetical protein